jgi:hypothetical protein
MRTSPSEDRRATARATYSSDKSVGGVKFPHFSIVVEDKSLRQRSTSAYPKTIKPRKPGSYSCRSVSGKAALSMDTRLVFLATRVLGPAFPSAVNLAMGLSETSLASTAASVASSHHLQRQHRQSLTAAPRVPTSPGSRDSPARSPIGICSSNTTPIKLQRVSDRPQPHLLPTVAGASLEAADPARLRCYCPLSS